MCVLVSSRLQTAQGTNDLPGSVCSGTGWWPFSSGTCRALLECRWDGPAKVRAEIVSAVSQLDGRNATSQE